MFNEFINNTTMGKGFIRDGATFSLRHAMLDGRLEPLATIDTVRVMMVTHEIDGLDLFNHPIYYRAPNEEKEYLFVDQRPFVTIRNVEVKISNSREYNHNIVKALLMVDWINTEPTAYKAQLALAGATFVNVLASAITSSYNLDPRQATVVSALTAMFYGQLVTKDMSDYDATMAMFDITKFSRLDGGVSQSIADTAVVMDTLEAYTGAIIEQVNSKKITKLNPGILLTLVARISFGYNIAETIGVALEYPPIWTAMVYTAVIDRSFKNSRIGKVALAQAKIHNGDSFIKYIDGVVKEIE